MTPREQKQFVAGLSETIAIDICNQIDQGKIPENWDGHELRLLLEYRHKQSANMTRNRKTVREVNNTIVVNDL